MIALLALLLACRSEPAAAPAPGPAADPTASDPTASDPTASDPTASDPTASDPTASDPTASDPTASDPTASDPTASDPTASDPTASDPTASDASPRPRLLLVTLDTTRADRLGAYGHAAAHTPHLDALAARGLRFDQAISPAPLTIPSHASLFTGLYPGHHGVHDNGDQRLAEDATTLAEHLAAAGWRTEAVVAAYVTQAHWGFGQGFHRYDDALGVPADRLGWRVERPADEVVDAALAALERRPDLLWVHLFDPHQPTRPPEPWRSRLPDPYDGELAFVDAELGRLLAAVPEETLVVVVGDHGEGMGEGGEDEHGLLLTEGVLRVPLIVAGPGLGPGVVAQPVSLVDLLPTVLRRFALPVPADLDGVDLLAPFDRPGVLSEARYGALHYGWAPLAAVTTAAGRLVRGTRDEGQVDATALALLEDSRGWSPRWQAAPLTLDQVQLEQLQALGYLAAPAPGDVGAGAVDPRDGVRRLQALQADPAADPAQAEARLRAILAEMPAMRDLRLQLAMLLARQGRVDEALAELATAHRDQPASTTAQVAGELWLQRGEPREALSWFDEALALDPRSGAARAGRVGALVATGQLDQATVEVQAAVAAAPDDRRLVLAAAELALATGAPVDPWRLPVEEVLAAAPWQPRVHEIAAGLAVRAGDDEAAEQHLQDELRWRPLNVPARLRLVGLLRQQGRHLQVVKLLRPLVNLDPGNPTWQAETARAYIDMGRADLAVPHIEACRGHPGCPGGG